ncbi:MAG: flagellar biosynthesis regulator FlaF [Pseudomonadota bacterium]
MSSPTAHAYAAAHTALATPRAIEHRLFGEITGRLAAGAEAEGERGFAALADALHQNQRLWMALALDLAQDGNGLPETLRAQLLSLAAFVHNHTRRVLAREATVEPLVAINTSVMRGLRGDRAAA